LADAFNGISFLVSPGGASDT